MAGMSGRLAGKVAIVTGAGSRGEGMGNGKAAAILFAREGASVVCVDQVVSRAEETVATILAEGAVASVFAVADRLLLRAEASIFIGTVFAELQAARFPSSSPNDSEPAARDKPAAAAARPVLP